MQSAADARQFFLKVFGRNFTSLNNASQRFYNEMGMRQLMAFRRSMTSSTNRGGRGRGGEMLLKWINIDEWTSKLKQVMPGGGNNTARDAGRAISNMAQRLKFNRTTVVDEDLVKKFYQGA